MYLHINIGKKLQNACQGRPYLYTLYMSLMSGSFFSLSVADQYSIHCLLSSSPQQKLTAADFFTLIIIRIIYTFQTFSSWHLVLTCIWI